MRLRILFLLLLFALTPVPANSFSALNGKDNLARDMIVVFPLEIRNNTCNSNRGSI